MKAFLEEYGLIVVVCIAFAVLVALVVWATKKGSESSTATINGFTDKATNVMEQNGVHPGQPEDVTAGEDVTEACDTWVDANTDGKCDTCTKAQSDHETAQVQP